MDNETKELIREVVSRVVTQGEMFTAYDLTEALREQGRTVFHSEIRNMINGMYNDGLFTGYSRTNMVVNEAGDMANVYHKVTDDPKKYYNTDEDEEEETEEDEEEIEEEEINESVGCCCCPGSGKMGDANFDYRKLFKVATPEVGPVKIISDAVLELTYVSFDTIGNLFTDLADYVNNKRSI